jgi:hypothetical protein
MEFEQLPAGWEVWSTERRRAVLAYRPDVFDSERYPPPCLPTIYVTKGRRGRRPGRSRPSPDTPWYVTLYLEPDVSGDETRHGDASEARDAALERAGTFAGGKVDYRSLYQVPRRAYLSKLDELTGR